MAKDEGKITYTVGDFTDPKIETNLPDNKIEIDSGPIDLGEETISSEPSSSVESTSSSTSSDSFVSSSSSSSSAEPSSTTSGVSRSSSPAESVGSKGYSGGGVSKQGASAPNKSGGSQVPGLEKKDGLNNKDGQPVNESPMQQHDPKEQAPDMGKDYGSPPEKDANRGVNGKDAGNGAAPGRQPDAGKNPNSSLDKGNELGDKDGIGDKKGLNDKDGLDKKGDEADKGEKNKAAKEDQQGGGSQGSNPAGNGYGALDKNKQNPNNGNDSFSRNRRNLDHANAVKKGKEAENASSKKKPASTDKSSSGSDKKSKTSGSGLGSKLRNKAGNLLKSGLGGNDQEKESGKGLGDKAKQAAKQKAKNAARNLGTKLIGFMVAHPFSFIIAAIVIFIVLIMFGAAIGDDSNVRRSGAHCNYSLSGVTSSGTVNLDGIQVELINCDGTSGSYKVLETVDFEKYTLGVALAEIGPDAADEALKAQIVAARGFALTRNSGMCPGNPDSCFYGYNVESKKIRMRACEADQVYWDYEKDIYRQDRGAISLYSPELASDGSSGGSLWKSKLGDERKAQVLALAEEVKGKVLTDSSGKVVSTNYASSESSQFSSLAASGKNYAEILTTVYSNGTDFESGHCTSYGNIDYGDYVLSSDGHEILHQPLDQFLTSKGSSLDEFNKLISKNVDKAGYGTRAGVVAAAVTLIGELGNQYNVKVPYFWGGGHADGVVDGALGKWGSTQCHTYANNQSYDYCGLDCSGFVPWAIKNGGFDIAQMLAGDFQNLSGAKRVSLSGSSPVLKPGDLLESSGHIVLVVGVEESSNQYICAEASGNSQGVLFTRRSYADSGYWGVDMDGFYSSHARSK